MQIKKQAFELLDAGNTPQRVMELLKGVVRESTLERYIRLWREGQRAILQSSKPSYNNPPIRHGDQLIFFDAQIPYQDGDWFLQVLELAQAWGIKQAISGGDFFNEAAFSIFSHPPEDMYWQEEKSKARDILLTIKRYIGDLLLLLGNHDAFIIRRLAHQILHGDIGAMVLGKDLDGFEFSDYYWCLVGDPPNQWRISHPRNISVIHGRVAQALAEKFQMNIASGHGHLWGIMPTRGSEYLGIDAGIMADPDKLDYASVRDSTRPKMCQGALILKQVGDTYIPYPLTPQWTDMEAMKRLYA